MRRVNVKEDYAATGTNSETERRSGESCLVGVAEGRPRDRAECRSEHLRVGPRAFGVRGIGSASSQGPTAGECHREKGSAHQRLHYGSRRSAGIKKAGPEDCRYRGPPRANRSTYRDGPTLDRAGFPATRDGHGGNHGGIEIQVKNRTRVVALESRDVGRCAAGRE